MGSDQDELKPKAPGTSSSGGLRRLTGLRSYKAARASLKVLEGRITATVFSASGR
jgi:hypothetical protein